MSKVKHVNIKGVDCFGTWCEDSNAFLVGDWADGSELDEIWCPPEEFPNWTAAVNHLLEWTEPRGIMVYELTAC